MMKRARKKTKPVLKKDKAKEKTKQPAKEGVKEPSDRQKNDDIEDKTGKDEPDQEKSKFAGKQKLIIFGSAGVLLVALIITGILVLTGGDASSDNSSVEQVKDKETQSEINKEDEESADDSEDEAEEEDESGNDEEEKEDLASEDPPVFYKFRPQFVVNLPSNRRIRYLQIEVNVMARSEKVIESVETLAPLLKSELITLFSNQKLAEVITPEGKNKLREEALKIINRIMEEQTGDEGVEQVLFTGFVTQ